MSREPTPARGSWYLLTGLLLGLTLGLGYAWKISPVKYVDVAPASLRADFKDQYRLLIASAYMTSGDLGRASARLALLGDPDPAQALNDQALRLLGTGDPDHSAPLLTLLAQAIQQRTILPLTPTALPLTPATPAPTAATTTIPLSTPTLRPTSTPTATPGAPFAVLKQENVCNPDLPSGLLQVEVRNAASQAVPGAELILSWNGGEEHFFTGFKPELGNGYADFLMTPEVEYTLQIASASAPVSGLIAPSCTGEAGKKYWGGIYLLFQQP